MLQLMLLTLMLKLLQLLELADSNDETATSTDGATTATNEIALVKLWYYSIDSSPDESIVSDIANSNTSDIDVPSATSPADISAIGTKIMTVIAHPLIPVQK